MQKSARFTEETLHQLGYTVVGNQAIRLDDEKPDPSWGLDRLVIYAKGELANSTQAEGEAILQSHKSAVHLFWAGCALAIIRDICKAQGRGDWARFKEEHCLAATTINDAIRLYRNAKTADALVGLGITEAKEKFVYPAKVEDETEEAGDGDDGNEVQPKVTRRQKRSGGSQERDDQDDADVEEDEKDYEDTSSTTLATELENMAQRVSEIALSELGKVEDMQTIANAIAALWKAVDTLTDKCNERLPG